MRSSLDTLRKPVSIPLLQDERVVKYYTASYDVGSSLASSWRLGNLYLTNKRLLFIQGRKISFGILLNQIKTINIVKRRWILGKKVNQLNIVSPGKRVPYIAIKDPDGWKKAIEERTHESCVVNCESWVTQNAQRKTQNSQPDESRSSVREVILKGKGGYLSPGGLRWRLGTLLLTHKKLAFLQSAGIVWEIPLSSIRDLRIEKRIYGVSESDTICVIYEARPSTMDVSPAMEKAWIISPNLETWRKELYERTLLKVDNGSLEKLITKLDTDSQKILYFLYENRYAKIDTLAKLIAADTHMDVLIKIREVINPTADKIIGYPILSFESSKADWKTGENITFSWWLVGHPQREKREPILDIFDDGANLEVYLELLGIKEDRLQLSVEGNRLIIDADKNYHKEILLPALVNTNNFTKRYKNNILEVRLKKEIAN